jgi:hypothetical protein
MSMNIIAWIVLWWLASTGDGRSPASGVPRR